MSIAVTISDGPVGPLPDWDVGGAGAVLVFEGLVREREGDGTVEALEYQAYEPMAQTIVTQIAEELISRHGLLGMCFQHSRGRVAVGECSFRLLISSKHRKEGLVAMDEFIDRLKRDVPIWKKPMWASPADR